MATSGNVIRPRAATVTTARRGSVSSPLQTKDGFIVDSFLGASISERVKRSLPLERIELPVFKKILVMAADVLRCRKASCSEDLFRLPVDFDVGSDVLDGVVHMLRLAVRQRTSEETVKQDLESIKISEPFVAAICAVLGAWYVLRRSILITQPL